MNSYGLVASFSSPSYNFNNAKYLTTTIHARRFTPSPNLSTICRRKIRAVGSVPENGQSGSVTPADEEEEPMVKFAFVHVSWNSLYCILQFFGLVVINYI